MTPEEAIKEIKSWTSILMSAGSQCVMETAEAQEMAIKALEKQIAKKPIIKPWNPATCPCCGNDLSESVGDGYYKHFYSLTFCECGQRLDWSEV